MKSIVCAVFLLASAAAAAAGDGSPPLRIAVEFTDHAAAAQIARARGWFEEAGLRVAAFDSYVTGMALSAALARGDVDAAYICLVPALNARINAGIDIRVVCGTHLYGYGLVADRRRVGDLTRLLDPEIRVGCVRQGGAVDVLMNRLADAHSLDRRRLEAKVLRMSPPRLVLALAGGRLDAAFLPEHYATLAEAGGAGFLASPRDCWPGMPGSVLVVRRDLLETAPETVEKLAAVTEKATAWINAHPAEAAAAVAEALGSPRDTVAPGAGADELDSLKITSETIERSMGRLVYTTELDPQAVRATMEYMRTLDYIPRVLPLEEVLAPRLLER
ncbi:MAG TPA: ABC transporter substrate-binding protein [bacterium]|nr:ABC transporter substrate-binding protein [bacterium]HPQ66393.1 ABC transporter substrate-binding protein [bacterium]